MTPLGARLLQAAAPAWRQAQARASEMLGEHATKALHGAADALWRSSAS